MLTYSFLQRHRQELIDFLLEGESCTSCGLRFSDHRSESYQQHLDWHFQQNRLEREGLLKTSRNWYLHPEVCVHLFVSLIPLFLEFQDWLSFEELTNGIHNGKCFGTVAFYAFCLSQIHYQLLSKRKRKT